MRWWSLVVAALVLVACTDDDERPSADRASETARAEVGARTLCEQWDKADAELAAADVPYDETVALVEMLPEEYERDAALFFYPYGGDPGPDADGGQAPIRALPPPVLHLHVAEPLPHDFEALGQSLAL